MKKTVYLMALIAATFCTGIRADSVGADDEGHVYLGLGFTSLALDKDRVPGVPTTSPSHTSKLGGISLGYQFNRLWAGDLTIATDMSDNVGLDAFAVNGYRFFGTSRWRPFVSAGFSSFSNIEGAPDDNTQQIQGGIGVSGDLNRNLELRVGYQLTYSLDDPNYSDKAFSVGLAWHFRKPEMVAVALPAAPVEKEVIDRYELIVLFDFDKSTIKSVYEPQFVEIAQVLKDNPDINMTIEGHTDWIGTEQYNQGLSERRAGAVRQKFIDDFGISPKRIQAIGFGESQPVADNNTAAGRQQNRRAIAVTIKVRVVTE